MIIATNEPVDVKRQVVFHCKALDGITPMSGLTFDPADIQIRRSGSESDSTGDVVGELGNLTGIYIYQLSLTEVDTESPLTLRTNRDDVYSEAWQHQVKDD